VKGDLILWLDIFSDNSGSFFARRNSENENGYMGITFFLPARESLNFLSM
jgi:hypothetical protein